MFQIAQCHILREDFASAIGTLNHVNHRWPGSKSALYWRALCRIQRNEMESATADLLAYLGQSPPGSYLLRCLRKLRDIEPKRLPKAIALLSTQQIDLGDREEIVKLLIEVEEGVAAAAQLLREMISTASKSAQNHDMSIDALFESSGIRVNNIPCSDPNLSRIDLLLVTRCWRDVIEILEARDLKLLDAGQLFCLALAHWGEKGDMPKSHCQMALQEFEGKRPLRFFYPEAESWALWRLGNVAEAIKLLDEVEATQRGKVGKVFSLWRHRDVAVEQFLDDCKQVRRMFHGESLRPAFLGANPNEVPLANHDDSGSRFIDPS